jgi:hypothetical protein
MSAKPGAEDIERAAVRLAEALGDAAVLVGGLAVSAWGYVRATDDIDFVANVESAEVQKRLAAAGLASHVLKGNVLDGEIPWCVKGRIAGFAFDVLPPLVPIDFQQAVTVRLAGGKPLRVVDLEALLRLKVRAGGPQDLLDVAQLLRAHPELVDRVRAVAEKYGLWTQVDRWMNDPRVR